MGRRFSISVLCMTVTAIVGLAAGQVRAPDERVARHRNLNHLFKRADANGDQQISREEWKRRPQAFDRIDLNHDGFITRDEAATAAAQRAGKRERRSHRLFEKLDRDHDGRITRDEWSGKPELFDRLDRNRDGVLTANELGPGRRHRRR